MPDTVKLHYKDGTTAEMDSVDARRALQEHPSEWSTTPFPKEIVKKESEAAASAEAKADEAAAGSNTVEPVDPPITNNGLKVGHIPSEVPALEPSVYVAKHRGGGSYSVVDADGKEVMEKLSKEDAEAFNGMTAEEKAAYVQADSAKG